MNFLKSLVLLISLLVLLSLGVWLLNLQVKTALSEPYSPRFVSTTSEKKEEMVSNNLLKLARAMVEFEGWHYGNDKGIGFEFASSSFNNHNPGNLKGSPFEVGKRNGFSVFVNDEVGFFALVWDLWKKAKGETSTGLTSKSTVYDLIKKYSGESENIVLRYVVFIEIKTGFRRTMEIGELIKNDDRQSSK